MFATLNELYPSEPTAHEDVLPALRELFSQHPTSTYKPPDTLARLLWVLQHLPRRPGDRPHKMCLPSRREREGLGPYRERVWKDPGPEKLPAPCAIETLPLPSHLLCQRELRGVPRSAVDGSCAYGPLQLTV